MKSIPSPEGAAVLVSWVSVNAGSAPLLAALGAESPLHRKIQRLYLCWRDAPDASERAAVDRSTADLHGPGMPEIIEVPWKTRAKPIDHSQIRPFAEKVLARARQENPGAHIYLHLSPGTPAMHAVWLVLGSTGFVEGPLTMIQSVREDQRTNKSPIFPVPFEVDTWLRHFRAASPMASSGDDDGKLWEPGDFCEGGRMRAALHQLRAWADLPAPVLLLGERGTGKSTLANFLRAIGPFQRDKKSKSQGWPSVVCGQFRGDPQMARSELFGHRKGAFTGANDDRCGLLEDADGDSLFLDEIADLDRDVQRLLMAALEGRGFHRLGDETRRTSRFRLICATNRSLSELAGGLLDPDFFDRVAVFTLKVPPLRECGPDLPLFWRKVLMRTVARSGLEVDIERALTDESLLDGLRKHPLPGNLRDLERVAWHLIAQLHAGIALSAAVDVALRALEIVRSHETLLPEIETLQSRLPLEQPLSQYLTQLQGRWVQAAMRQAEGNQTQAAKLLNVTRETFKGWLKRAGES